MRDFFSELKRRHVYKVAVFYAVTAWIMIQIADLVLENFNASDRIMQGVIVLAAVGFPIVLVLAWMYDLGPEGVVVTPAAGEPAKPSTKERPGIVVLPFDSYTDTPEDEILSKGFTEDLTTLLAHIDGFFVISRNSAYAYKDGTRDVREIGRELGVRYLLEGSLRRMGEQVRVTAQLIQADDGGHLWADNYDAGIDELHEVQDDLLHNIALQLGVELARAEFKLARRKNPRDMDAWSLYQQARGTLMFMGWSENSMKQATEQLRQAIVMDPDYAPPHAYLSLLLALGRLYELVENPQAAHDEALQSAERALELDSTSSEVLGYVGCALSDLNYKQRGIPIIERAIELDPSNAQAHAALGAAKIVTGNLEEGIVDLSQAIKISPRDPGLAPWSTVLSIACAYGGRADETRRWAELACKADSRYVPGLIALGFSNILEGRLQEAREAINNARELYPKLNQAFIERLMGEDVVRRFTEAGIDIQA
jgi:TolB-like protein/Flp pilus assembly protein TadD